MSARSPMRLRTAALALEYADDAGAAQPAMHFDAPLRQFLGNDAGRSLLLETDLGVRVQIAADRGQFIGEAFNSRYRRHSASPSRLERG